jgi:hypothetical protein
VVSGDVQVGADLRKSNANVEAASDTMTASVEFDLSADQFVAKPRHACSICYL